MPNFDKNVLIFFPQCFKVWGNFFKILTINSFFIYNKKLQTWLIWALLLITKIIQMVLLRLIQLSHPTCNNTCLVGIILCLGSIFLLGLDGQFVSENYFPIICCARAWVLCLGFSLAYGAMFSKVWLVHRLTTKAKTDSKVSLIIFAAPHHPHASVSPMFKLIIFII